MKGPVSRKKDAQKEMYQNSTVKKEKEEEL